MKKIIFLLLMPFITMAQVVVPKSTTTFSNVNAVGSMTVGGNLRVTGSETITGAATLSSSTTIGTGTVAANTSSLGIVRIKQGTSKVDIGEFISGYGGIAINNGTNTTANYNLISDGSITYLNGVNGITFQINGGNKHNISATGLRVGSATAASATLDVTGTMSVSGTSTLTGIALFGSSVTSSSKTGGIGYAVGSGSTVTQGTSRTTGVTINAITGAITLVSAAGSTSWQSFTVTNSAVAVTDVIIINQKSGTDLNEIHITAVAAGSFNVSFKTTGGTTTEQPVFNFAVIKGQTN